MLAAHSGARFAQPLAIWQPFDNHVKLALVRANARVYDVSLERVARTVGRQFEAGSSVPIGDVVESF